MHRSWRFGGSALAFLSLSLPMVAWAQVPAGPAGPMRPFAGAAGLIAQPVGEFNDYVGVGGGLGAHFLYRLDPQGIVSLRVDGGFINYGRESREVCLSATVGCRVTVRLTTDNNIFFGSIGPQLMVPEGVLRPYVNAGAGVSYFATTSSVRGTSSGSDAFASTTNFDDATLAWFGGGGLYIPLSIASRPVLIDLAARYTGNGEVEYLRKGGIEDHPDGSITLHPTRSQANLVVYQIGVSIGLGRRR